MKERVDFLGKPQTSRFTLNLRAKGNNSYFGVTFGIKLFGIGEVECKSPLRTVME